MLFLALATLLVWTAVSLLLRAAPLPVAAAAAEEGASRG